MEVQLAYRLQLATQQLAVLADCMDSLVPTNGWQNLTNRTTGEEMTSRTTNQLLRYITGKINDNVK